MTQFTVLNGSLRNMKGKEHAKKLRLQGMIPAVVYGHSYSPVSIEIQSTEIKKIFKAGAGESGDYKIFSLLIQDNEKNTETSVIIKDIQRHPVSDQILHIDFYAVKMDETIVAPVHIRVIGKSAGVKLGGIQRQILREVQVKSLPASIPSHFEIDVTELQIGHSVHVKDLQTDPGVTIVTPSDETIVTILAPIVDKSKEEETAEGEEKEEEEKTESKE